MVDKNGTHKLAFVLQFYGLINDMREKRQYQKLLLVWKQISNKYINKKVKKHKLFKKN